MLSDSPSYFPEFFCGNWLLLWCLAVLVDRSLQIDDVLYLFDGMVCS
jgi:hypothetical protein